MSKSRVKRLTAQLADEPKEKLIEIIDRLEHERDTAVGKLDPGAMFEFVKHGDQHHQDWLREAFEAYVAGKPKPEPRGLGRHGAQIAELQSRLSRILSAVIQRDNGYDVCRLCRHRTHMGQEIPHDDYCPLVVEKREIKS